jgi:adenylate cyclase
MRGKRPWWGQITMGSMAEGEGAEDAKLTFSERGGRRMVARRAGKNPDEPLTEDDWGAVLEHCESRGLRAWTTILRRLPHSPRCRNCGAPFAGAGGRALRLLGFRPSRKNPTICGTCVEGMPPGGYRATVGVMFADLRGFTERAEGESPSEVAALLNRFYGCAEAVLLDHAFIDKLIGDEVMALYMERWLFDLDPETIRETMVADSTALLGAVGYGTNEGPFVDVGIGLDHGEAFVGNVGDRYVFDFTAIGDVVNTASRLQCEAASGEVVFTDRVAAGLPGRRGERVDLELKGKGEPQAAYRLAPH